jgi:hypothetical protein
MAADLAEQLAAVLQAMDSEDLAGSAATRYRIEGAVIALNALGGVGADELLQLIQAGRDPE